MRQRSELYLSLASVVVAAGLLTACDKPEEAESAPEEERLPYRVHCDIELVSTASVPSESFSATEPTVDAATDAAKDLACAWLQLEAGCASDTPPSDTQFSYGTVSTPDSATVTVTVQDSRNVQAYSVSRTEEIASDEGQPQAFETQLVNELCVEAGFEAGCLDVDEPPLRNRGMSCYVSTN